MLFRGFLKGDKALGQVQVKLNAFDNKCEIHDCLDVSNFFFHLTLQRNSLSCCPEQAACQKPEKGGNTGPQRRLTHILLEIYSLS